MTVYNVLVPVVKLVSAPSRDQAVSLVADSLREAGFDPFLDGGDANAFEDENQDLDGITLTSATEPDPRGTA
jgi:hypothetical protein